MSALVTNLTSACLVPTYSFAIPKTTALKKATADKSAGASANAPFPRFQKKAAGLRLGKPRDKPPPAEPLRANPVEPERAAEGGIVETFVAARG